MEEKLYKIELNYKELCLLDNLEIRIDTQQIINNIKKQVNFNFDLPEMGEILFSSIESGKFYWEYTRLNYCKICKKSCDYARYTRSTRYHRRGEKNHSKPIYFSGLRFNPGFVVIRGYGDMCSECESKYNVIDTLCKYIFDNDLKIEIKNNDKYKTKYKYDQGRKCFNCKKEMYESEMGSLPAMISGRYKGICPHCGAKSLILEKSHEITDKFRMIQVKSKEE